MDGALFICHWSIIHFSSPCIIIQFNTKSKLHPSVILIWQQVVVILLFTCKKIGDQLKTWKGLPIWRTRCVFLALLILIFTECMYLVMLSDVRMHLICSQQFCKTLRTCRLKQPPLGQWQSSVHSVKPQAQFQMCYRNDVRFAHGFCLCKYKRGLNMMPLCYGDSRSFLFLLLRLKHGYNFHYIKLLCSLPSFVTTRNNVRKIEVPIP